MLQVIYYLFFTQEHFSGERPLPVIGDDSDEQLYFSALPYDHDEFFMKQLMGKNEDSIKEFIEILNMTSKKLRYLPLSKYHSPEGIVDKILSLRDDGDLREARKQLYLIYKNSAELSDDENTISEQVINELEKRKKRANFVSAKVALNAANIAATVCASVSNWTFSIYMIPLFFGNIFSLKENFEERKSLKWIGFFEKYSNLEDLGN